MRTHTVMATALFYTDQFAQMMLQTGPIPNKTLDIIGKDLNSTYGPDVQIKVRPVYRSPKWIPVHDRLLNAIKKRYPKIFVSQIPKSDAAQIMTDMRTYMTKYRRLAKVKKQYTVIMENILGVSESEKKRSEKRKGKKVLLEAPMSFEPSAVYYAVDSWCVTGAKGCGRYDHKLFHSPSNFLKPLA